MPILFHLAIPSAKFQYELRASINFSTNPDPLLGNRIYGWMGDVIDIMAVITTLFGLATTIGFGVGQINSGPTHVFGIPSSLFYQVIIILAVTLAATIWAFSGLNNGTKILSVLNVRVAMLIFFLVLILGPTTLILRAYTKLKRL